MNQTRSDEELYLYIGAVLIVPVGVCWGVWQLAAQLSDIEPAPSNPIDMVTSLVTGNAQWPMLATILLIPIVVAAGVIGWRLSKGRDQRRFDRAARKLPTTGLKPYIKGTGPKLGQRPGGLLTGSPWVKMTDENTAVVVAGPRTGKTTTQAIPTSVQHQGPLVVTSNKRDIADAIWLSRSELGNVWLFDPQSLAPDHNSDMTTPTFWWNPLTMATDLKGARRLATIWSNADRKPGTRTDPYFEPAAVELLSGLLLTAAINNIELTRVYSWLTDPGNPEPIDKISGYADFGLVKQSLENAQTLPDKQRAGVYGTALKTMGWIADPTLRAWFTTSPHKPHFDVENFATSTDTLISLSREGEGSATPLVTALTAAVLMRAEEHAARQPSGRLQTELLAVLDEAANVCRWQELPNLYSHYGSRGILLLSIFQSWAQIVDGFGKEGAEKLWDSANVRLYLGGAGDTHFLRRLSELCGKFDERTRSSSYGKHGRSRSQSFRQKEIFDISALGALPPERCLALLSAASPTILKTVPWWELKQADQIQQSIDDPNRKQTRHYRLSQPTDNRTREQSNV